MPHPPVCKLKGLETTSPLPHPAAPPPNPFLRSISSCPESAPLGLGSAGSGQGRQGHTAALLSPRGHGPCVRGRAGGEGRGASPGLREGGRPI